MVIIKSNQTSRLEENEAFSWIWCKNTVVNQIINVITKFLTSSHSIVVVINFHKVIPSNVIFRVNDCNATTFNQILFLEVAFVEGFVRREPAKRIWKLKNQNRPKKIWELKNQNRQKKIWELKDQIKNQNRDSTKLLFCCLKHYFLVFLRNKLRILRT